MGHWNRLRMGGSKSILSVFVAFCLLFSLLSTTLSTPVEAKSTRAAIIVGVSGTVTVKKAGGSKSYTAYGDMTLNQGDVISTGSASSVVLRIADHEDEITIDANAEVSVTDLANEGNGKQSKLSSWAGSMWVKVKSLVSSEDEFEVETPTAVMGVRGTQFFTGVNPLTGATYVTVGAGAVNTKTTSDSTNGQGKDKEALLLPTQQIVLDSRNQVDDLNTKVSMVDIFALVDKSSAAILEAIIKNKAEIDKENQEFIDKKKAELIEKNTTDNGISTLTIKDIADLNKIAQNLNNIVGNIAKTALEQNKIDRGRLDEIINQANQNITDPSKKLDLDKVEKLDPTAGLDAELEKKKQEELLKLNLVEQNKLAEKAKLDQELLAKFQTILDAVAKEKVRVQEENKKAQAEALQRAESAYTNQLSDTEKKRFEESKNSNNNNTTPTQTPATATPGTGSGTTPSTPTPNSSNNNVTAPPAPVIVDPTQGVINTSGSVQVKVTAVSNSTIEILNGDSILATLPGQGDSQVTFNLTLTDGNYNLTARTLRSGRYSAAIAIPTITVGIPDVTINQQSGISNNKTNLELKMKNFIGANQFYAVEAHLVYNNASFKYSSDATLTDVSGTVFDGTQMAETLNPKVGFIQSELIYAASQFETTGEATVNNISLSGEKLLVTIPLDIATNAADPSKVDLVYVKIVNKSGQTVYEMGSGKSIAPKSIDVKTK